MATTVLQPNSAYSVLAETDITFLEAGITDENTNVIYRVDGAISSYRPGRPINGITAFENGKGYYILTGIEALDLTGIISDGFKLKVYSVPSIPLYSSNVTDAPTENVTYQLMRAAGQTGDITFSNLKLANGSEAPDIVVTEADQKIGGFADYNSDEDEWTLRVQEVDNGLNEIIDFSENDLLKTATLTPGKLIDSTGAEVTNASTSYYTFNKPSGLIFIEGVFTGIVDNNIGGLFGAGGVFIQKITTATRYAFNAAKTRLVIFPTDATETIKLTVLNANISSYKAYDGKFNYTGDSIKPGLLTGSVNESDIGTIYNLVTDANFFDWLDFAYLNNTPGITASTVVSNTGLIPVKEGDSVEVSGYLNYTTPAGFGSRGWWFDDTKRLSSLTAINSLTPTYVVPVGARYVALNYEKALKEDLSIKIVPAITDKKIPISAIYPAIVTTINGWAGKNYTSDGDSRTQRNMWQPHLVTKFGLVHTNLGISSTCMINAGPTPISSDDRIQAVIDSNPFLNTIMAGTNDLRYFEGGTQGVVGAGIGTTAELDQALGEKNKLTFYGAYSYYIERLLTWKPTLRIAVLATPFCNQDGATYHPTIRFKDLAEACRVIADYYSLIFVDTYSRPGFNDFTFGTTPYNIYSDDTVHENAAGGKRLAEVVIGELEKVNPIA